MAQRNDCRSLMSSLKLELKGVFRSRGDAVGLLQSPGDAVLIERGRPRWLLISCPCGCGDEFPINLDSRAGPAWKIYRSQRTGLSIFPSIWRDTDCESHYVIWNNRILLFGIDEREFNSSSHLANDDLCVAVLKILPNHGLTNFSDLAEALGEVPWDVLMACRQLKRSGLAHEGKGEQRGSFGEALRTGDEDHIWS
jgi:hypothetical protein